MCFAVLPAAKGDTASQALLRLATGGAFPLISPAIGLWHVGREERRLLSNLNGMEDDSEQACQSQIPMV